MKLITRAAQSIRKIKAVFIHLEVVSLSHRIMQGDIVILVCNLFIVDIASTEGQVLLDNALPRASPLSVVSSLACA